MWKFDDFFATLIHFHIFQLVYGFNCGSGSVYIDSIQRVDDGRWHFAEFSRNGRNGKLYVDGEPRGEAPALGTSNNIEVVDTFHVGGLPDDVLSNPEVRRNLKVGGSQCGNSGICLLLRFYVKSIVATLEL